MKINRKSQRKTFVRLEACPFSLITLAFTDFNRLKNTQELLGYALLFNAGRTQQVHKRCSAAIHDGHFLGCEVNVKIVDTQPGQGGHQVFDSRYPRRTLPEDRGHPCIFDHASLRW